MQQIEKQWLERLYKEKKKTKDKEAKLKASVSGLQKEIKVEQNIFVQEQMRLKDLKASNR